MDGCDVAEEAGAADATALDTAVDVAVDVPGAFTAAADADEDATGAEPSEPHAAAHTTMPIAKKAERRRVISGSLLEKLEPRTTANIRPARDR